MREEIGRIGSVEMSDRRPDEKRGGGGRSYRTDRPSMITKTPAAILGKCDSAPDISPARINDCDVNERSLLLNNPLPRSALRCSHRLTPAGS